MPGCDNLTHGRHDAEVLTGAGCWDSVSGMSKLLPLPDFDRITFDDLKVFSLQQDRLINTLLDDLARAKGLKARPDVKPSGMEVRIPTDRGQVKRREKAVSH